MRQNNCSWVRERKNYKQLRKQKMRVSGMPKLSFKTSASMHAAQWSVLLFSALNQKLSFEKKFKYSVLYCQSFFLRDIPLQIWLLLYRQGGWCQCQRLQRMYTFETGQALRSRRNWIHADGTWRQRWTRTTKEESQHRSWSSMDVQFKEVLSCCYHYSQGRTLHWRQLKIEIPYVLVIWHKSPKNLTPVLLMLQRA